MGDSQDRSRVRSPGRGASAAQEQHGGARQHYSDAPSKEFVSGDARSDDFQRPLGITDSYPTPQTHKHVSALAGKTVSTQPLEDLKINDTPASVLKNLKDPFDDSPDSTSTPARSKNGPASSTRPFFQTPANARQPKDPASMFKKMRDQLPEAFEYDTEVGLVLDGYSEPDETADHSGAMLNLNTGYINLLGKFNADVTANTSPDTQIDANIHQEINDKLRQQDLLRDEADYSYLSNYHRRQSQPSSKPFGLPSSTENTDHRDVQVPGTIEKSRVGIASNSSPLTNKTRSESHPPNRNGHEELNDEIISSQSVFSQITHHRPADSYRTQKDPIRDSSPNINEPSSQEVSDFEIDDKDNISETLKISNSQNDQPNTASSISQKELKNSIIRLSQNSQSSQRETGYESSHPTVHIPSQDEGTRELTEEMEDPNSDADANSTPLSQVAYTSSLLLRPKRVLKGSPRKASQRKPVRPAPPVIELDDSSSNSSDQENSNPKSDEQEVKDSMDETRINSVLDRDQIDLLLSTKRNSSELPSPEFENANDIQSQKPDLKGVDVLPESPTQNEVLRTDETEKVFCKEDIIFPRSVWVTFDNLKLPFSIKDVTKYYDESRNAQFSVSVANSQMLETVDHVKLFAPLSIRVGDHVKLFANRTKVYKVTGLQHDPKIPNAVCCIRGFNRVYLCEKGSVLSDEFSVPLEETYLTANLSGKIKFKIFDDEQYFREFLSNLQQQDGPIIQNTLQEDKLPFHGCVFVFTSAPHQSETNDTTKVREMVRFIEKQGGLIIEEGFPKLFQIGETELKPGKMLEQLKFAALLSPKHVRTMKYLQSLSLGWPILSTVFLEDLISKPDQLSRWQSTFHNYMLPAGHSVIRNCILSANVFPFLHNFHSGKRLHEQTGLVRLLDGLTVVVDRSSLPVSVRDIEFLLKALGCHKTRVIPEITLQEAAKLDCRSLLLTDLDRKSLDAQVHKRRPKKQRRESSGGEFEVSVVDWEWLVQCIIGGTRFDPVFRWKVSSLRK
ncbi:hypothetical protein KL942_003670 [Ogataea angusta]|uniref:Rad9-like Rad53-binding domain-containing protein n=1 Tax=Pichia angusta TaxID=870730 RepID=A0ABQ7RWV4_PICAN|nr:hypothetical protein KL942_003670 [Ogataea angusta]KAG7849581.1 hypothetical protein KL940_002611 [Ogataea angusta]